MRITILTHLQAHGIGERVRFLKSHGLSFMKCIRGKWDCPECERA